MPIEPASVSKPAIREVEQTSKSSGFWNSMQGSSTGGKDSHLNSIWDKAISGAQKLFGLDSSNPPKTDDNQEKDDSDAVADVQERQVPLNTVPGFANRGFGRFGVGSFSGNAFTSVNSSRSSAEFANSDAFEGDSKSEFLNTRVNERAQERASDRSAINRGEAHPVKEKPDASVDDEDEVAEKPAATPVKEARRVATASAAPQAGAPIATPVANPGQAQQAAQAVQTEVASQTVQAQTAVTQAPPAEVGVPSTQSEKPQGQPIAQTVSQLTAKAQETSSQAASVPQTQAKVPAEPVAAQSKVAAANQQPAGISERAKQTGVSKTEGSVEKSAEPVRQTPVAQTKPEGQTTTPVVQASVEKPMAEGKAVAPSANDSLAIDAQKAKDTLGAAFDKLAGREAKPVVATQQPTQQAVSSTAQPAENAQQAARPTVAQSVVGQASDTSVASKQSSSADANARDMSVQASQTKSVPTRAHGAEVAAAAKGAVEGNAAGEANALANASQKSQAAAALANHGQATREAVAAANARPVAASAGANRASASGQQGQTQTGVGGVGSSQSMAAGPNAMASQRGQSQGQGSENSGANKQDFAATMKNGAELAKGAEKATSSDSQAFDVKSLAGESRKAEVVAKTKQTSYVSKTAEELKEVISTLTKSIDRLVSNKLGTMNLRINFDQGGSMTLKISMDRGQVHTNMQTDVQGLEGAIKANWSELANDWNQRGVKLTQPQFQQSSGQQNDPSTPWNDGGQRQDRQFSFNSDERNSRQQQQGSDSQGARGASRAGTPVDTASVDLPVVEENRVVSDKELKTYA